MDRLNMGRCSLELFAVMNPLLASDGKHWEFVNLEFVGFNKYLT